MADLAGYGFAYDAGSSGNADTGRPMQLFAWQVCLVHLDENSIEDADNYPDYLVNRARITQSLGLGMAQGQNAFPLGDQLFAVAVSIQNAEGGIELIDESYPRYNDVATVIAEQLLRGGDHGMVAQLANGNLVPFLPSSDAESL